MKDTFGEFFSAAFLAASAAALEASASEAAICAMMVALVVYLTRESVSCVTTMVHALLFPSFGDVTEDTISGSAAAIA